MIQGKKAECLHVDSLDSYGHADITTTTAILDVTGPKFQHPNQPVTDFPEVKGAEVKINKASGIHVQPNLLEN